jgi:ABC-type transport system involved in cytochrome c biogenesis ATPase subunit
MVSNSKISISGFGASSGQDNTEWLLNPGAVSVVCSSLEGVRRSLLNSLAGRNKNSGLRIRVEASDGHRIVQALPSAAVLPPPGEEMFVGTTVGEQLGFYDRADNQGGQRLESLDNKFGFGFSSMPQRSVWELGAGERRCLLLVSQAMAGPRNWIMHSPLERMDGARQSSVLEFIDDCTVRGGIVVAASGFPVLLMGAENTSLIVLGDSTLNIIYQGEGESAVKYLAQERRQV